MSFFALALPHLGTKEWMAFEWAFMLFALLSFLRVSSYAAGQLSRGRLIQNERSPISFAVPGIAGWTLVVGVLMLLFLRSDLYMLVAVFGVGALTVSSGRTPEEQFGLRHLSVPRVVGWSVLVWGAVAFIEMPLGAVVERAMDAIHLPHPEQQSMEIFRQLNRPLEIVIFMIQAVLIAPVIEELFFRGFLLTFLKRYTTSLGAILFSGAIFAMAHANIDSAIPLWFLGIVLGLAYQHTGSLLLPMGIHACWNFFTAISLILEKGNG